MINSSDRASSSYVYYIKETFPTAVQCQFSNEFSLLLQSSKEVVGTIVSTSTNKHCHIKPVCWSLNSINPTPPPSKPLSLLINIFFPTNLAKPAFCAIHLTLLLSKLPLLRTISPIQQTSPPMTGRLSVYGLDVVGIWLFSIGSLTPTSHAVAEFSRRPYPPTHCNLISSSKQEKGLQ